MSVLLKIVTGSVTEKIICELTSYGNIQGMHMKNPRSFERDYGLLVVLISNVSGILISSLSFVFNRNLIHKEVAIKLDLDLGDCA
jgi:hypothetical protein